MYDIIVTGHGKFASGLLSALSLIMGEQDGVVGLDFTKGMSSDELMTAILKHTTNLSDNIIVLADLAGGTPFNTAVKISIKHTTTSIHVIAGTNISMLIEAVQRRDLTLDEAVKNVLQAGNTGLQDFKMRQHVEVPEADGI